MFFEPLLILLVFPVIIILMSIKIMREYERAVVFLLGRYWKVKGPGLILIIPGLQTMVRVDLRTRVLDVPSQDVISRDNVSVKVNAVLYFRILEADKAVIQVEDFAAATSELAQTTLRSVLGKHELDEMLAERDKINDDIQVILDNQTVAWGVKVANVELKHVDIDETMVRAIAKQAEAERIRRAKVINAEGEFQAAETWQKDRRAAEEAPVEVGIGIHFGPVTMGDIGGGEGLGQRFEFAVIGDTVNVASRLERMTRELDVSLLISDAVVQRLAERPASLRSLGAHHIDGRSRSIVVWTAG